MAPTHRRRHLCAPRIARLPDRSIGSPGLFDGCRGFSTRSPAARQARAGDGRFEDFTDNVVPTVHDFQSHTTAVVRPAWRAEVGLPRKPVTR